MVVQVVTRGELGALPVLAGCAADVIGAAFLAYSTKAAEPPEVPKPHKLTADRQEQLRRLAATGEPVRELAAAFGIGRAIAQDAYPGW